MNVKVTNREILKAKVAELLVLFKEANGITFQALAELLDTTYLQVHRWTSEKTLPDPSMLKKICSILGVDYATLCSTASFSVDRLTIDSITDHYKMRANDPKVQRKYIILAAGLIYDYLVEKELSPVLLLQTGANAIWSLPADPDMHNLYAMYTCSKVDNLVVFGSSLDIKFQFLSANDNNPVVSLSSDNLITAVSTQLITRELKIQNV